MQLKIEAIIKIIFPAPAARFLRTTSIVVGQGAALTSTWINIFSMDGYYPMVEITLLLQKTP